MVGCKCIDVEIQSYDNQTCVAPPKWSSKKLICIDTCILEEILNLWDKGIITNGCCCGHNKMFSYVGVSDKDIDTMQALGYVNIPNRQDKNHFFTKTVPNKEAEVKDELS